MTWPFVAEVWWGELPPLALYQMPKVGVAELLLDGPVLSAMDLLGLTSGAPSPDRSMGEPSALVLAYLLWIVVALGLARWRGGSLRRSSRWIPSI